MSSGDAARSRSSRLEAEGNEEAAYWPRLHQRATSLGTSTLHTRTPDDSTEVPLPGLSAPSAAIPTARVSPRRVSSRRRHTVTTDQVSSAQEEQDQADETPEDRKARLAGYGSRRGTREAFARAFRKLLKRRDDAAAVKGQTTVAVAIVATVDELEDGTHRIVACELLRSVGTVQATAVILQAASEVIARELEDPASVRR